MNSKLANTLNNTQKSALEAVCKKFAAYPAEVAFKYLWNLTYKPQYALQKMELVGEVFYKHYRKVRNYILEQSGHTVGSKEDYPTYLFNALGQDKFAAKRIIAAINEASEPERIQKLLSSTKVRRQFGGLKSLHLNNDEANYFMPAVSTISQYFTEVLDKIKEDCVSDKTPKNLYALKEVYGKDFIVVIEHNAYIHIKKGRLISKEKAIDTKSAYSKILNYLKREGWYSDWSHTIDIMWGETIKEKVNNIHEEIYFYDTTTASCMYSTDDLSIKHSYEKETI